MTVKEIQLKYWAERLNGREYGAELTRKEESDLKVIGLVVAFGYSDDNVEFRGAFNEEVGGYEKIVIPIVDGDILIPTFSNECSYNNCPLWNAAMKRAITVTAFFTNDGWKFETDIPHEKFTIMEDGEIFGEGIVFCYEDVGGRFV